MDSNAHTDSNQCTAHHAEIPLATASSAVAAVWPQYLRAGYSAIGAIALHAIAAELGIYRLAITAKLAPVIASDAVDGHATGLAIT
jgi:hypothetical protein